MAAPTVLSFRADKYAPGHELEGQPNGKWKVFGPANLMEAGKIALVTKKDGTDTEVLIARISKTFDIEGVECAYGYLAETE